MHFIVNRYRMTHGLDLTNTTGVEIGPLVNPIVRRSDSNINYIDRASTVDLREWYSRDDKINVDDIMDIDYIWGDQSLAEATGGTEQFDYCIASHVIEHIPDLITWLGEIASILKTGGLACFAVPDKRYTFDYLRPLTTTADLVDSYLNKLRKPSFKHIFDHFSNFTELDIQNAWSAGFDGSNITPLNSPMKAYSACVDSINGDKYVDSHCSVFTEESFFPLLASIADLGLLDFTIKRTFKVKPGMFEFIVQLEKLDSTLSAEQKSKAFRSSLTDMQNTELTIEFSSDRACVPKLYCDFGQGFNETESQLASYENVGNNEVLHFALPQVSKLELRFDPSDHECEFCISEMKLVNGKTNSKISLDTIQPINEIMEFSITDKGLSAKTTHGASDPSVFIPV